MDIHKTRYEAIIHNLINKETTTSEIISFLHKNRLKFDNSNPSDNNNASHETTAQSLLYEKYLNSSFVSFFIKYLHDESNAYLVMRVQNQTNQIKPGSDITTASTSTKLVNKNNNLEDSYNSSFHISPKTYGSIISPAAGSQNGLVRNSPTDYSNIIKNSGGSSGGSYPKRRALPNQIHTWANQNSNATYAANAELKNSPTEFSNIIYNNKNKRKTLVLQPKNAWENSSTPKIITPTYSNKLTKQKSKVTLFDFVTSPPVQQEQSASKQDTINDFKARFYQHQNKLEKCEQNLPDTTSNLEEQPLQAAQPQPQKQITDFKAAILEKLTDSDTLKLTLLAELYASLLLNNFILTINTELFFLFQLLTLSIVEERPTIREELTAFASVEACIYFSMVTLKNLECILKYLKSSTLMELKENIYIKSFASQFYQNSVILRHEIKTEDVKSKQRFLFFESKQAPFYAHDTTNFHDNNMSITSKNQRDAFYDIFWQWEKNHKLENWNFAECLGDKIRLLVSLKENMTHFIQFVKLFQEQLVLICKDDKMLIDNQSSSIDGPEHIRSIYDPLKLKQLNARMSTPRVNYGPNPSPTFFGYQEFFKEFIDISSSPIFHQYLKDNISNEIELIHKDIPDINAKDDSSFNKDMIEDMLLRLRILGKFLGYLYFSPYSYPIPNHFIKSLTEIRNNSLMPFNLQCFIERAIEKKHLILTIPFVVEFLSMMDEHAYLIDSIQQAISMLIIIYNSATMLIRSEDFTIDKFLLLIYIAWLLQLKKIQYSKLKIDEKLLTVTDRNRIGVDNFSIITPILLDFCCPFLDELQKLMVKFTTGVKRYEQKIRDVSHLFAFELVSECSSQLDGPNNKPDKQQIQMQLISQFLFLHPSYKRLVEFAAETTLANYIKYFRQTIFKRRLNDEIKLEAAEQQGKEYDTNEAETILTGIAKRLAKKFADMCVENSLEFFKDKIENVIVNSIDRNSTPLIDTTSQIALYKTVQKLSQWVKSNLNEEVFCGEVKLKMCKKIINNDKLLYGFAYKEDANLADQSLHRMMQSNYLMLFEKFNYFKVVLKELCSERWSELAELEKTVVETLVEIKAYLIENREGNKLLKPFDVQLCNLVWEILMFYVTSGREEPVFFSRLVEEFVEIEILVNNRNEANIMTRLFCPRNVYFLQSVQDRESAINNLKLLLTTSIRRVHARTSTNIQLQKLSI